ncbi:MAG TPA: heme-binding domain-containing protein [Chitinophaga sp.]|uniref:heme-binding domain-containing protein n=1 Tax=Chitinophaga sp. TaxID=1869181 RepID=UPI002DBAFA18|nr:heme-binding domain-containing protein [Chitinophaga sp.]HEU4552709.1 heme-binding domain-containing protein [Chitinophaga sp.]
MQSPNRKLKRPLTVIAIFILFITAVQFIQPPVQNPPVTGPLKAPHDVAAILQRACYDCHSNETKLSWYNKIAPVSWLVTADVTEARSRFNFSTWDTLSPADQQGRIWEMVNMALTGKMPLPAYRALHPQARLSAQDIAVLKKYANDLSPYHYHDTAIINQAARELNQVQQPQTGIPVAANGVKYIPEYRNWQVISTTNRFDNHSIRIVYGNAIAAKAVKENHMQPFPEGSAIVKVVWNSIEEKDGGITPGSLNSVQIMVKDSRRFPGSKGWGFAKFNGVQLKPYGATPLFNTTCYNCHKIAGKTDLVFNIPPANAGADGSRKLFDAGGLRVITLFANTQQQTMSVLYGNSQVFKLVTYKQANNTFWYGSHINGPVQSIETVTAPDGKNNPFTYRLNQGQAPADSIGRAFSAAARIRFILSHKPAVFR